MSEPFAYLEIVEERLLDHSVNVGITVHEDFLKRGFDKYIARIMFNVLKVDENLDLIIKATHDSILISSAFHDLGKAWKHYQENLKKSSEGNKYISFKGHEGISALLVYPFMEKFILRVLGDDSSSSDTLLRATVRAVMMHHHTMIGRKAEAKDSIVKFIKDLKGKSLEDALVSWPEIVYEIMSKLQGLLNLKNDVEESLNEAYGMSSELTRNILKIRQRLDMTLLRRASNVISEGISNMILYALITADNMVAIRARGGSPRWAWEKRKNVVESVRKYSKVLFEVLSYDHGVRL